MMNWYYIDGPRRVGPFDDPEWADLVRTGKVGPDTLVWNEELSGWVAYRAIPPSMQPVLDDEELQEEEEAEEEATLHNGEAPEGFAARVLEHDYPVPFRACLSRGVRLFKDHFWLLLGSTLLTYILISVGGKLPGILGLAMPLALTGVLQGGLYSVYLRLLRREPAVPTDLFSGFEPGIFRNLVMRTLIGYLLLYGCLSAGALALGLAGFEVVPTENQNPDPNAMAERLAAFFAGLDSLSLLAVLLALLVCITPFIYLGFCWVFAIPLIWDKRMPFAMALQLSRRKVLQHPWRVSGFLILAGIIAALPGMAIMTLAAGANLVGSSGATAGAPMLAAAFIAISFALPLYFGAYLSLYETVFNESPALEAHSGEGKETAIKEAGQPE